jgi:hypothetical protein
LLSFVYDDECFNCNAYRTKRKGVCFFVEYTDGTA